MQSFSRKICFSLVMWFFFVGGVEICLLGLRAVSAWRQDLQYTERRLGQRTILCFGDSVTMGHGVLPEQSWPRRLQGLFQPDRHGAVKVVNRGDDGITAADLLVRHKRFLQEQQQQKSTPIVLLMIGHIDLLKASWRTATINKLPQSEWHSARAAPPVFSYRPRVWRISTWFFSGFAFPEKTKWEELDSGQELQENIVFFQRQVEALGGRLYLLTYPVPGKPPADLSPLAKRELQKLQHYQMKGNQILRQIAKQGKIRLLDIEKYTYFPKFWHQKWYLDHIHPGEKGHQEIARSVLRQLVAYGEFPISYTP